MSFLVFYTFSSFFKNLASGSTVYGIAITEGAGSEVEAFILLTASAEVPQGTIHALRLNVVLNGADDAGEMIRDAFDKLSSFLELKGMIVEDGVLLTEGLKEALGLYITAGKTTKRQIDEFVAKEENQ